RMIPGSSPLRLVPTTALGTAPRASAQRRISSWSVVVRLELAVFLPAGAVFLAPALLAVARLAPLAFFLVALLLFALLRLWRRSSWVERLRGLRALCCGSFLVAIGSPPAPWAVRLTLREARASGEAIPPRPLRSPLAPSRPGCPPWRVAAVSSARGRASAETR